MGRDPEFTEVLLPNRDPPPPPELIQSGAEKMAPNGPESAQFGCEEHQTKNGPYLGLRGPKPDSDGTQRTMNPPRFAV